MLRKIFAFGEFVLLVLASVFFLRQFVVTVPLQPLPQPISATIPPQAYQPTGLYLLINKERTQRNLSPLVVSRKLETSAALKACDMRDRHYFNHTDPDGQATWIWFDLAGYVYAEVGENIGVDLPSNTTAHQMFMASSKHRANILSPTYEEMGVARCGRYVVEHFGTTRER